MLSKLALSILVAGLVAFFTSRWTSGTLAARYTWHRNFSWTRGAFGAIAYTFVDGSDRMQATMNDYRGQWNNVGCFLQVVKILSGYGLFVLALGIDSNAMANLVRGTSLAAPRHEKVITE